MNRSEGLWDMNKVEGFHTAETTCEKANRVLDGSLDIERHRERMCLESGKKFQSKKKQNLVFFICLICAFDLPHYHRQSGSLF